MESKQQDTAVQHLQQMQGAATVIQSHYRRYCAQRRYRQQQQAAGTIRQHAIKFLARRKAGREQEEQQTAARFKAVMARHQERIQQLELEKQRIMQLPGDQLGTYHSKRHAAATVIQACWRGSKQRQHLRVNCPAMVTLRPVTCTSPTTMDRPEPGKRDQNQQQYQQSVAAGSITACLYNEPSAAIVLADGSASSASHVGLMSSSSFAGVLRAEPSSASAMLAAEASKLSAVGAAALEGIEGPKRSDALPAARRMVLERQVQLRVDAFKVTHAGGSRLAALWGGNDSMDQRLVHLLQEHQAAAAGHLKAARSRQKLLQKAEVLHNQLQQLPKLSQLPDSTDASQFVLPAAHGAMAEKARQAHALALAEAKVGSKWWLPLKGLNQKHKDAAAHEGASELQQEWQQQEAAWKASWARITLKEQQRDAALGGGKQQAARDVLIEQELCSESSWHAAS